MVALTRAPGYRNTALRPKLSPKLRPWWPPSSISSCSALPPPPLPCCGYPASHLLLRPALRPPEIVKTGRLCLLPAGSQRSGAIRGTAGRCAAAPEGKDQSKHPPHPSQTCSRSRPPPHQLAASCRPCLPLSVIPVEAAGAAVAAGHHQLLLLLSPWSSSSPSCSVLRSALPVPWGAWCSVPSLASSPSSAPSAAVARDPRHCVEHWLGNHRRGSGAAAGEEGEGRSPHLSVPVPVVPGRRSKTESHGRSRS